MSRLLDDLRRETAVSAGQASALPFGAYSDPDVFELELERIFQRDWLALCPAANLANAGDYLAVRIGGEPLVVMRGKDGALRAMSNVCRHRGTLLLDEGFGSVDRFLCPVPRVGLRRHGRAAQRALPGRHRDRQRRPRSPPPPPRGVGRCRSSSPSRRRRRRSHERLAGLDEHLAHYDLAALQPRGAAGVPCAPGRPTGSSPSRTAWRATTSSRCTARPSRRSPRRPRPTT